MNRNRNQRQRSRDPLDKRVDQWIETGRQFVDGVAGTRPGQRKYDRLDRRSTSSLGNVGRWVEEKLDWFLEEDDEWIEPLTNNSYQKKVVTSSKKPLEAISRRITPMLSPQNEEKEEWPNEETFKIDRWNRNQSFKDKPKDTQRKESIPKSKHQRKLPKSNRNRT